MSIIVNIAEAKAKLSELVARAEAGEEVIIARAGAPAVRLEPAVKAHTGPRKFGGFPELAPLLELDWGPDPEVAAALEAPIDWAAFDDPVNQTPWPFEDIEDGPAAARDE